LNRSSHDWSAFQESLRQKRETRIGSLGWWGLQAGDMALRLKAVVVLACFVTVIGLARADEDIADGEDGYMDTAVESAVIESCAGWRLNKLPEVKRFLQEDFESLYENTKFKKVPGKSPELKFYNQHGEALETLDIAKMTRSELNKLMVTKGIARRASHNDL